MKGVGGMTDQKLHTILEKYKGQSGALIPALQEAQETLGYLSEETLEAIAQGLRMPFSRVYGVVTFYAQFYLTPRGKHTIKSCQGTACHVKGASRLLQALEDKLKVKGGGTTDDLLFSLETVACLGTCFLAPVVLIDSDYYGAQTPQSIRKVLRKYAKKEKTEEVEEE